MELGTTVLEGLSVAGDAVFISDQAFNVLIDYALQGIVSSISTDNVINDSAFKSTDKVRLKSAYSGIVTLLIEAAKWDAEPSSIGTILEDCHFASERINSFNDFYIAKKQLLQLALGCIGTSYPHIVDVDWRLDYYIKNNHIDKVNQAVYLVTLKTKVPEQEELKEIQISCSMEQLQDLVGKLKDATKCLERIAQS